jgi:hypothetical protein
MGAHHGRRTGHAERRDDGSVSTSDGRRYAYLIVAILAAGNGHSTTPDLGEFRLYERSVRDGRLCERWKGLCQQAGGYRGRRERQQDLATGCAVQGRGLAYPVDRSRSLVRLLDVDAVSAR